ncbi:MAG: glycosyltransferase [Geodermatophilaceae bacterium]|nr:glycosyltransferase [Geodermatophilaceae bacterium]
MTPSSSPRIGYVLKMYPRFSETFIVSELLAREAAGADIDVFSLRPPVDGRFHEALAQVRAHVTYLGQPGRRGEELWRLLGLSSGRLPGLPQALPDLLAAEIGDAAQALELALLAQERGITHLHAHFGSVATTVARLASLIGGVPYSFTAHAKDIFHDSTDPADLRRKLRDAHHVVTVSRYNARFLTDSFGVAADSVRLVYNGLDLDVFDYSPPVDRPPVIAAVGRLIEKKGFDVLIEACALLHRSGRSFSCQIVGSGDQHDTLRELITARGLTDVISLLGPLPQNQVRTLLAGSAVFAAPCVIGADGNRDGLPTVLLEAMALGTPCVSTDVTGIPEVLRDGETGLLVGQNDPADLALALDRLLGDPPLGVRLARNARDLVEADFDSTRQAAALDALLTRPTEENAAAVA